jgi:hypothetical protein
MKTQEEIQAFIDSQPYYGTCTHEYKEGIELGIDWIQEQDSWISVDDRLPENDDEVLIYCSTDVVQAYLKNGYWKASINVTDSMNDGYVNDRTICKQGETFDYVTHWQPLPNPPKQ